MAFGKDVNDRLLRDYKGMYQGKPRIYNVDRGTWSMGYTEINNQATSPVARIKVHRARFEGASDIVDGDLIQDKATGNYYLCMSVIPQIIKGESAYKDATLFFADAIVDIERFGTGNTKNAFGRPVDPTPTLIASGIRVMTVSMALDVLEQKDQNLASEKIKIAIQEKYPVVVNDRIKTTKGDVYKVMSVDNSQLLGLQLLYVDRDIR